MDYDEEFDISTAAAAAQQMLWFVVGEGNEKNPF